MAEEQRTSEDADVLKKMTRKAVQSVLIALVGSVIVCGGFFVLVWGEAQVNIATTIKHAPHLNKETVPKGVATTYTGALSFTGPANDPLLKGTYAFIRRHVETCAWIEVSERKQSKNKLKYIKVWTPTVPSSNNFQTPGYDNPKPLIKNHASKATGLTIGEFNIPETTQILSQTALIPRKNDILDARFVDDRWAYMATDKQCHSTGGAAVGDQRIRFDVLKAGDLVTIFGRMNSTTFSPYRGQTVLAYGQRDALIQSTSKQRKSQIWLYRACGSVLLWIGLYLIINSLLMLVSGIPVIGLPIKGAVTTITMVIAVAVTAGFVFLGWGMSFFTRLFGGFVG